MVLRAAELIDVDSGVLTNIFKANSSMEHWLGEDVQKILQVRSPEELCTWDIFTQRPTRQRLERVLSPDAERD
ncbi:MAG: hypothetical protein AAFX40_15185 [Cyanobacteria bacterium J06639_1]